MSEGRIGVFLDRDGTLNEEVDFVRTADQLRLIPGAVAAVKKLNDQGTVVCVISNQSGVARGYITEEDLVSIHAKLKDELRLGGAHIDRIYYCPHHPTEGVAPYNVECDCRKPKPGMLKRGEAELDTDLGRSFLIGDSVVDMQAAHAVGASAVLVRTGYGKTAQEECRKKNIPVAHVAASIVDGVDFVLDTLKGRIAR